MAFYNRSTFVVVVVVVVAAAAAAAVGGGGADAADDDASDDASDDGGGADVDCPALALPLPLAAVFRIVLLCPTKRSLSHDRHQLRSAASAVAGGGRRRWR